MSTEIFYFSGTGNSLAVAKDIAEKTNGKLINLATLIDTEVVRTDAQTIGLVFPVHYIWNGGVPLIVERFIKKVENIKDKYIFSVFTCGGGAGDTVKKLGRIINSCGGKLSAGFSIKMPYNYTTWSGSLASISIKKTQGMLNNWKKKLDYIIEYVNAKSSGKFETDSEVILFMADFLNVRIKLGKSHYQVKAGIPRNSELPFDKILPLMDKSFHYDDEKCNGCGTCLKVCPVKNIEIVDSRPSWKNHCEQCFACIQWCSREAIQYGDKTTNCQRYHHPDIKLSEFINMNRNT